MKMGEKIVVNEMMEENVVGYCVRTVHDRYIIVLLHSRYGFIFPIT